MVLLNISSSLISTGLKSRWVMLVFFVRVKSLVLILKRIALLVCLRIMFEIFFVWKARFTLSVS